MKLRNSLSSGAASLALFSLLSASGAATKILMAGDSTMAAWGPTDHFQGYVRYFKTSKDSCLSVDCRWGVPFEKYVSSSVRNLAVNGASARTFLREGNWTSLLRQVERGDFVIISFGHYDQGNPGNSEGAPVCASDSLRKLFFLPAF